jgi:hypothetical protein
MVESGKEYRWPDEFFGRDFLIIIVVSSKKIVQQGVRGRRSSS